MARPPSCLGAGRFAVFAVGIGVYAAALALWPLMLVWWPWLLAAAGAFVAVGAWWLWWRLPKRQMRSITAADPKARADIEGVTGRFVHNSTLTRGSSGDCPFGRVLK